MKSHEELLLGIAAGSAQGIFEWLPASSKTILLLIFYWAGLHPSIAYLLGIFLNGSTAAAAIAYFRKDILRILRGFAGDEEGLRLLKFLVISTAATGLTAPPLTLLVARHLGHLGKLSMLTIGILYLIMSILLWRSGKLINISNPDYFRPYKDGLLAGLAQGFSALPGISRSGITILVILMLGKSPTTALRLSFLMSIPATLSGSAYTILINQEITASVSATVLITATATAITVSLVTIATLLKASRKLKPHMLTLILAVITLIMTLI